MKSCAIADCERPYYAAGYCCMHYSRKINGKEMAGPSKLNPRDSECKIEGCDNWSHAKGLCVVHYGRHRRVMIKKALGASKEGAW